MTNGTGRRWALVLAAGSGTRLSALTALGGGNAVPKQFCSLAGGPSLLQETLRRAERVASRHRTVAVVAAQHAKWWIRDLEDLPQDNVVVQPLNRGTAAGVLLPLLMILDRDPDARVVLLPSDHFVADETVLAASIERAFEAIERDPERIALLGIEPDAPDSEYGWILPNGSTDDGVRGVRTFVEKPRPDLAAELLGRGGLWNSFILVATGAALKALYLRRRPSLLTALASAPRIAAGALGRLYAEIPTSDFSRELLQGSEERLVLLTVPQCGWSDLGTPARVASCVAVRPVPVERGSMAPSSRAPLNLSTMIERASRPRNPATASA